jgi:hypothetical protein
MLITCPECLKEISDKAKSCPHCGYPIDFSTNTDASEIVRKHSGDKIKAITEYRQRTGASLREAKDIIDLEYEKQREACVPVEQDDIPLTETHQNAAYKAPKTSSVGALVAAIIIICAVAVIGLFTRGGDDNATGATAAAKMAVKSDLKAPSSAKFSSTSATENDDGSWTVRGYVDAQNSFGTMVRNSFIVDLKLTAGRWDIEYVYIRWQAF